MLFTQRTERYVDSSQRQREQWGGMESSLGTQNNVCKEMRSKEFRTFQVANIAIVSYYRVGCARKKMSWGKAETQEKSGLPS